MSITHIIDAVLEREYKLTESVLTENGWKKVKDLNFVSEFEKDVDGHPCIISIYHNFPDADKVNIFWLKDESNKIDAWKPSFTLSEANAIFSVYNLPHVYPSCQ